MAERFGDGSVGTTAGDWHSSWPPDWLAPWVLLLAILGGLVGAALNALILRVNAFRQRLIGSSPSVRRRAAYGVAELLLLALLSSSCSVLLPELTRCQPLSIGQLEYGRDAAGELPVAG